MTRQGQGERSGWGGVGVVMALLLLPSSATATPIIQEVFYDAVGPDAGTAFTEIYGPAGLGLDGWSLVGVNGGNGTVYRTVDLTGVVIPPDGLVVIAGSSAEPLLASVRDHIGNVDWQNGPDALQLINPLAVVVDALQYGEAGPFNAGEGNPAPDAPAGASLARDSFGHDTNDNLRDFVVGIPTPGVGPTAETPLPVPEPGTVLLLGTGLLVIALRRRR